MSIRNLSERLCEAGALLHVEKHQIDVLVGYWEWITERRVFYFEAGLTDEFGGHLLEFDSVEVLGESRIYFRDDAGTLVASLFPVSAGDGVHAKNWRRCEKWRETLLPFILEVRRDVAHDASW